MAYLTSDYISQTPKNSLVNGKDLPDKCYFSESFWKKVIHS